MVITLLESLNKQKIEKRGKLENCQSTKTEEGIGCTFAV